jgi:hypothetical protein
LAGQTCITPAQSRQGPCQSVLAGTPSPEQAAVALKLNIL